LNFRRYDLKTCKIPALMAGDRVARGQSRRNFAKEPTEEGEKPVKTLNLKNSRRDSGGKEAVTAE
jgi:hypothetical protein